MNQGALIVATAGEEVVPASEYRALEAQVRELQRLLRKKTVENELLREAVSRAADPKKLLLRSTSLPPAAASTPGTLWSARGKRTCNSIRPACQRCMQSRQVEAIGDFSVTQPRSCGVVILRRYQAC